MNREKTVEIPFGNKRVRLVGIDHGFELDKSRKENSDFDKRKGEYHKEIKQSDLVILEQPLEYFPDVEGSNIDFYQADFFKKIGKIAYNEKRPIYVCDPINFSAYSLNLDLANTLGQGNVQKYNSRYRLHEWRDLVIAKHLDEIFSNLDFEKITSIHGAKHNQSIVEKLLAPNTTRKRLEEFRKFNEIGLMSIRKYIPSDNSSDVLKYGQSWKKI